MWLNRRGPFFLSMLKKESLKDTLSYSLEIKQNQDLFKSISSLIFKRHLFYSNKNKVFLFTTGRINNMYKGE